MPFFDIIIQLLKFSVRFFFSLKITYLSFFITLIFLTLLYYILPLKKRWIVFTIANLLFVYGASSGGKWAFCCMFLMMIATWLFAQYCKGQKTIFIFAILFDIGILLLLKDVKFFARILHIELTENTIDSIQRFSPIGISYWMLALVAYLVDVHKERIPAQNNFAKFLACTIFFPTLVSGPILRLERDADEILEGHKFDYEKFCFGVQRIIWGVFKKVVVADRAAIFVAKVFDCKDGAYKGFYIWIAATLFFVQLFADFSGCIDIALGSAELFGIKLPKNFDLPFASKSIAEFWRRWHITLGGWLRDYIYIPLGGNRKGKMRKYFNIMTVFLVSGLWHGGAVKFLAWGALHGVYQIIGDVTLPLRKKFCKKIGIDRESFSFKIWQCAVVFVLNIVAWIFFRAGSFTSALQIFKNSLYFNPWIFFDGSLYNSMLDVKNMHFIFFGIMAMCAQAALGKYFGSTRNFLTKCSFLCRVAMNIILAFFIVLSMNVSAQEFLYGQF